MKKSKHILEDNGKDNGNNLINLIIVIIGFIIGFIFIYYFFIKSDNKSDNKTDVSSISSSSPPKSRISLKMGESLAGISWNVKVNTQIKGKADPFKIVFDTQNTGHIDANQKTLEFIFGVTAGSSASLGGKSTFTYSYKGNDLYHLNLNNELWQLSFTRVNGVVQENLTSFVNTDRMIMLDVDRSD